MIQQQKGRNDYFDARYQVHEQIPRRFTVTFHEVGDAKKPMVRVIFNDSRQVGDVISDNSYSNDFYRYHDVFHYSFATILGWSPCTRALIKCKRKSDILVDEVEDGARATITEEAVSMVVFNEAKRKKFFEGASRVSRTTLRIIKEMTENFEVRVRTAAEWETAILRAYEIFRQLVHQGGGKVEFDLNHKRISII